VAIHLADIVDCQMLFGHLTFCARK
jgi:hypothetical protein